MRRFFCLIPFLFSTLFANPTLDQVVHGEAHISFVDEKSMQIKASDKTIIHWKDFSIRQDDLVQLIQPSSDSAILNRVVKTNTSEILGKLQANGKVYLINPHGVLIGTDAVIETNGFIASTLDVLDESFLKDKEFNFKGNSENAIVNLGLIKTNEHDIYLIARKINNEGTLQSQKGGVYLAAGHEVILKEGHFMIRPELSEDETVSSITNNGMIEVIKEKVQEEPPYSLAIKHTKKIDALEFCEKEQKVILHAVKGNVEVNGSIHTNQGNIKLHAEEIHLQENSLVQSPHGDTDITFEKRAILEGKIQAKEKIQIASEQGILYQKGNLDVSGKKAGEVSIDVHKAIGSGTINAEGEDLGGTVVCRAKQFIETSQSCCSAKGAQGGMIEYLIEEEGSFFSSGSYICSSTKKAGGEIKIAGSNITLAAAFLEANGSEKGGEITIGKACDNEFSKVYICPFTKLKVNCPKGKKSEGTIFNLFEKNISAKKAEVSAFPSSDLVDPNQGGGSNFGSSVVVLTTNGNVVVTKPNDNFAATDAGAVYLYNGDTRALISTLTGSQASDQVGSGGVTALTNGNYVVQSPLWDNGGASDAGAVTFGNGTTGVTGAVSSSNSLVGSTASDQIGSGGVTALTNGNYVVQSPLWDNGGTSNAGAVTFGSGTTGVTGAVSSSNSLVGSTASDQIGSGGVTALTNGNYVVQSPLWDNGGVSNAGAATFGDGTTGVTGAVSTSNSLHGSTASDQIGSGGVTALTNGNYVVVSSGWDNGGTSDVGAATFGDGTTGITGAVTTSNSLHGSTSGDFVSSGGVIALTNGNYVVLSPFWDNGASFNVGAATFGNGTTGTTGAVTTSNSLHGSTSGDTIGLTAIALTNGNYVVESSGWNNGGILFAGAVTFGDGTTGISGAITTSNSLHGTANFDAVGSGGVIALTNGNYVVASPAWDNGGTSNVGAATFGNGTTGTTGAVSTSNSLHGSTASDQISSGGVTALTNGNYVVQSPLWDNGGVFNAGAATFGNGTTGTTGAVSSSNSLVGSTSSDQVSSGGVTALTNGNYVVQSPLWDNGGVSNAGAATFGNGSTGTTGAVSTSNSLHGSTASDQIGSGAVVFFTGDSDYVVTSPLWDNGALTNAGAASFGDGTTGGSGAVSSDNSIVGGTASTSLQSAVINNVFDYFLAPFPGEDSGRVAININVPTPSASTTSTIVLAVPDGLTHKFFRATFESLQKWNSWPLLISDRTVLKRDFEENEFVFLQRIFWRVEKGPIETVQRDSF